MYDQQQEKLRASKFFLKNKEKKNEKTSMLKYKGKIEIEKVLLDTESPENI